MPPYAMGYRTLLLGVFAVAGLCPAQVAGVAHSGKQPVDTLAPTPGVKSADEIDREWQLSVSTAPRASTALRFG